MFTRLKGNKRYSIISKDAFGIVLRVPRYRKTDMYIGNKESSIAKGFCPKGTDRFYVIDNDHVVIDGFFATPCEEPTVEISITGKAKVSASTWPKIAAEIESLLREQEES